MNYKVVSKLTESLQYYIKVVSFCVQQANNTADTVSPTADLNSHLMKISAIVKHIPDPPPVMNATLFLLNDKEIMHG